MRRGRCLLHGQSSDDPGGDWTAFGNFGFDPLIRQVIAGDVNNDGLPDIFGFGEGGTDLNYNDLRPGIVAWTATGKRTFGQPKYFEQTSQGPGFIGGFTGAGFLDKDGKRDLIVPWGRICKSGKTQRATRRIPVHIRPVAAYTYARQPQRLQAEACVSLRAPGRILSHSNDSNFGSMEKDAGCSTPTGWT